MVETSDQTGVRVVGFGGTARPGSSSERLVMAVLAAVEERGAAVRFFGGADLTALPHFDPTSPDRSREQLDFVEAIRSADAVVIGSPGYHGGVSGIVKNAIDLLEDTARDDRTYLADLPVGLVVSAAGWQAGGVTLTALRGIVHAMRGWPTPLGISINSIAQRPFDEAGNLVDAGIKTQVETQAAQIIRLARAPLHG